MASKRLQTAEMIPHLWVASSPPGRSSSRVLHLTLHTAVWEVQDQSRMTQCLTRVLQLQKMRQLVRLASEGAAAMSALPVQQGPAGAVATTPQTASAAWTSFMRCMLGTCQTLRLSGPAARETWHCPAAAALAGSQGEPRGPGQPLVQLQQRLQRLPCAAACPIPWLRWPHPHSHLWPGVSAGAAQYPLRRH